MADERFLPSLLDRLVKPKSRAAGDAAADKPYSIEEFRDAVKRDLGWLLNAERLDAVQDLEAFPEASRSVVNFGVPNIVGQTVSSMNARVAENLLRDSILEFEPRILPDSLQIRVTVDPEAMSTNAVRIEIRAEIWARPTPQELLVRLRFDPETRHFLIPERERRGAS